MTSISADMPVDVRKILFIGLYLGIAPLAVLGPCTAIAQPLVTNPLDAKLKPFVDRYNEGRPTMVAPKLREDRATVFNGVITYRYTDVTRTAAEMASLNLEVTQRPYIVPTICKAPDTGRMLREGVAFRYLYAGNDGKLAAQLIVLSADCATAR